ncbi:protein CURVATURE THYLAKOID 1D, chloroplastic [Euphorbia lathyris]|uniref:protein CURVATURE THYLAKOID 1D, chloroplastic n=1 Tax=Euphorbia lathyris TaxID=212925 RepID=UPI003313148F
MELCTTQSISNLPRVFISNPTLLRLHSPFIHRHAQIPSSSRFSPLHSRGFIFCTNSVPRATLNEETSTGATRYTTEEIGSTVAVETDSPIENKAFTESPATEAPNEESPVNGQLNEFLENLNIKVDSEDTYSLLLLGGGSVVALWLASAVVGAIDSIPLFPKLMEVVGLGYTLWFTTRYLLFKENRDELGAKIEELKQQVVGSMDE